MRVVCIKISLHSGFSVFLLTWCKATDWVLMNLYDTYENEFELSISTLRDMIAEWKRTHSANTAKQITSEFEVAKDTIGWYLVLCPF